MNERIREIADQILPNEKEFHQGNPKEWGYFFSGDELEKFAELIVQDCLAQVARVDDMLEDEPAQTAAVAWVASLIAQHFGVDYGNRS